MDVFINNLAAFLPNQPVDNSAMEEILGLVNGLPSKTTRIILRNNKINRRHYAIDPQTGRQTHTNAQLTAEVVRRLSARAGFSLAELECLCCGTSSPDQLMPGHGLMVHGELGEGPCEVITTAGICLSGITALKFAWLNVAAGQSNSAVATGSELASSFMHARICGGVSQPRAEALTTAPELAFDADFLRWMLSDGAGAALLANRPNRDGISLKLEWLEHRSFAHLLEPCMYAGASKRSDGSLSGWREEPLVAGVARGTFNIKQDVKLLNQEIVFTAVDRMLPIVLEKHRLRADEVDWFLPHYSSDYFRNDLYRHMVEIGFGIPEQRWFTNLKEKGNTGAASIYIILEELFHSGHLKRGDKLLCFIPESGRFSMAYMLLSVC
jgi:3-oxoacyl-[acyl-carrier-protein] synthase III